METTYSRLPQLFGLGDEAEFGKKLPEKKLLKQCSAPRILLVGPSSCGKSSLLFEYAIHCAEKGDFVLFISPKPILKLPLFVNGRTLPNVAVLKRINMLNLANVEELVEYFSNIHLDGQRKLTVNKTRHVIIDHFGEYFMTKGRQMTEATCAATCLAYIVDALEFWSKNM